METNEMRSAIEAILFASGDPVEVKRIAEVLGIEEDVVFRCAKQLADEYSFERRGVRLVQLDGALQLCSAPEYAHPISRVLEQRSPPRLSQAAVEVLAIIAYYQPVTRAYVEQIRGVDSSYTVNLLTQRHLIEPCGKLEAPGRPTLYRTGKLFLRTMGITALSELPELPDLSTDEGVEQLQNAIEALKIAEAGPDTATKEVEVQESLF